MIFGIGTDICKVERFKKLISNPGFIERVFNEKEILKSGEIKDQKACEYYASRFAVKEAFSKALGTGIVGFSTKDVYISNEKSGKPLLNFENNAENLLKEKCGNYKVHVSISHEKEFATAFVIIETLDN